MNRNVIFVIGLVVIILGVGGFFFFKNQEKEEKIEGKVVFTLFYGNTCPHCKELEEFMDTLDEKTKSKIDYRMYEVYDNFENLTLMKKTAKKFDVKCDGVPCFFIGEKGFNGYASGMNKKILNTIEEEYKAKHFNSQVEETTE